MKITLLLTAVMAMVLNPQMSTALDAAQTNRVDALFKEFDQPHAPGASVLVIHQGKTVFAKGYGLADLERKTPCTVTSNFRLASVSKQFTAMAVLILSERGKLNLEETLADVFPEFPAYGKTITIKQLLTHTSGLLDYEDLISPGTTLPVLDQDVLRILMTVPDTQKAPTYFAPGAQYRYSNSAFALLALIVEARSGQTFAHFLKENIFTPLQMTNTLAYEQGLSVVPQRVFGHTHKPGGWQRTDQSLTSSVLGDGGIYSSVTDLMKWDQALYTTKLVSERTLNAAFQPIVATKKSGRSYGFGWFVSEYRGLKEIWHSGDSIGFRTRISRLPEKEFTVIILSNRSDAHLDDFPHQVAEIVLFGGK